MADLIADGLNVGFWDLTAAAIPETCGHAMEVPESTLNSGGSLPLTVSSVSLPIHAAIMSTPGAAISGCKVPKKKGNDLFMFEHLEIFCREIIAAVQSNSRKQETFP